MVKGETRVDSLQYHDTHLLCFAYLHVQLGEQVARKYVQMRWQIMRHVNIRESNVPEFILRTKTLKLEVSIPQESEVIPGRNEIT